MSRRRSLSERLGRRRPEPRRVTPALAAAPGLSAAQQDDEAARQALVERRDGLARDFAAHQWDLGGMAYEMASRDHFRLDVLQRHAARLQELDGELAEAERLLKLGDAGASGTCPSCGAMHARGAVYCWQCGTDLMATQTVEVPVAPPPPPVPPPIASEPWPG